MFSNIYCLSKAEIYIHCYFDLKFYDCAPHSNVLHLMGCLLHLTLPAMNLGLTQPKVKAVFAIFK